jgi:hypothetical protein
MISVVIVVSVPVSVAVANFFSGTQGAAHIPPVVRAPSITIVAVKTSSVFTVVLISGGKVLAPRLTIAVVQTLPPSPN